MTVEYSPAPAVERIARRLISKHHTHLDSQRIEYVFRSEAAKDNGKTVWGKARKVTGLNAFLARGSVDEIESEPFFVVEIALDVWSVLKPDEREALVDHELTHCVVDDEGSVGIRPHDVEEFKSIIERHGLWRPDIEEFFKAANGIQLPFEEGE